MIAVVAVNRVGVIGNKNGLPWQPPAWDLEVLYSLISGQRVVIGRKTFEALPHGARNKIIKESERVYILTRNPKSSGYSWDDIVRMRDAVVIGGAAIYQLAAPYVKHCHISRIDDASEGDTFFDEAWVHKGSKVTEYSFRGSTTYQQ